MIPDDHKCLNCGRDKYSRNFYVAININSYRIQPQCNSCKKKRLPVPKRPRAKTTWFEKKNVVKLTVKERVDIFFKEEYEVRY